MEEDKKTRSVRAAVIGLLGTLLTVCGGLLGGVLTATVTVYQVERERQHVALPAASSEQTLNINTRKIAIDHAEAARLDRSEYDVVSDLGFALAKPRAGWGETEELAYRDLFLAEGEALSPLVLLYSKVGSTWDEQAIYRIRHEESLQVQYQEGSKENGVPVDVEALRRLAGTDTFAHYSQIMVLVVDKEVAADYTLAEIAMSWGTFHRGGVNRIVAGEDSQHILMQATWQFKDVWIDGHETDLAVERWALFAEGPQHYYVVELIYVPQAGQTMQVWEDLQAYWDSFHVVR